MVRVFFGKQRLPTPFVFPSPSSFGNLGRSFAGSADSSAVIATQNRAHCVSIVDAKSMLVTGVLGLGFFHVLRTSQRVAPN